MKIGVAILAAGSGSRFKSDKTLFELGNQRVWQWSVQAFESIPEVTEIVIVTGQNHDQIQAKTPHRLIPGKGERQDSARVGVEALLGSCDLILVHDGARPFVGEDLIKGVIESCTHNGAAAPSIPVKDTIRKVPGGVVDRNSLRAMQTPQAGTKEAFQKALAFLDANPGESFTDEMALFESAGIPWSHTEGSEMNFKITTQADAVLAQGLLRHEVRSGLGYDVHPFSEDQSRPLYLGGVRFENEVGLEGHSDADVVIHAAVDALLGAAALGDIGVHFPPADPQWKNASSVDFLAHAGQLLKKERWAIQNLDIAVIAEIPKIMPRAQEIRTQLAAAIQVEKSQVSIKATTNEGLGAIGRKEGIAAFATASIERFRVPKSGFG